MIAFAAAFSGQAPDEQLRLARDMLRTTPASGKIAIVEIDARSLEQVAGWPWPRRVHARLVDRLRDLGASPVAFDVDLSSTSSADDDAALAAALSRSSGSVILPTFRQKLSSLSENYAENLPIPAFREHAFLGSVNVQPDADGQLRQYSYGTQTAGSPRPSIAALLAGSQGRIGTNFRVDTAIDPATIPRVSAIDVLNGRVSPQALRGKSVLIGATAIEMGDRYIVPGHGILPGVVVQVLATETLLQGTMNPDFGPLLPLGLAILVLGWMAVRHRKGWHPVVTLATALLVTALPFALEFARIGTVQIVPALSLLALDALAVGLVGMQRKFSDSRLIDAVTGLPNPRALERLCRPHETVTIITASVLQFEEMDAVLASADRASVIAQVVSRVSLGFPDAIIHAAGPGTIAWIAPLASSAALHEQIDAAAALFRAPVTLGHRAILVTPAFGLSTGSGSDARQVLAQARFAVRQAQRDGRRIGVHSEAIASEADRTLTLLADVEQALQGNQIYVVYQPKWHVAEARVAGAEALVRWTHPLLGPVGPDEFIPLLEANGQMRTLTLRVIDLCFDQLSEWDAKALDLVIAVNVSAVLLDDGDFVAALSQRLEDLADLAYRVTLEVTESATISSTKAAVAALTQFRSYGARVSIDDYGTGHATLAYLKSFPADEIKIDKSFVTNMLTSNSDQIVVRSTIELAHELGFKVVAEGAEDAACLMRLSEFGCDTVQGWVIGKPLPADAFMLQFAKAVDSSIAA